MITTHHEAQYYSEGHDALNHVGDKTHTHNTMNLKTYPGLCALKNRTMQKKYQEKDCFHSVIVLISKLSYIFDLPPYTECIRLATHQKFRQMIYSRTLLRKSFKGPED
jgi:hypothetical protein